MLPDGVAPFQWYKAYCWETEKKSSQPWSQSEEIGLAIATAIFPFPVALAYLAPHQKEKIEKVKVCRFEIRDNNGKLIRAEDREVSREDVTPGRPPAFPSMGPAAQMEAINTNPGPEYIPPEKSDRKDEVDIELSQKDYVTNHSSDEAIEQEVETDLYEVRLYAADFDPNDDIDEYILISNRKVGQTYFVSDGFQRLAPNTVYKGSDLRNSIIGNIAKFDPSKDYEVLEIIPVGHPRRNITTKESYKKGILKSTEVKVLIKPK